jgi:hypothetical protein
MGKQQTAAQAEEASQEEIVMTESADDPEAQNAERLAYLGGEQDDADDFDLKGLDRGDSVEPVIEDKDDAGKQSEQLQDDKSEDDKDDEKGDSEGEAADTGEAEEAEADEDSDAEEKDVDATKDDDESDQEADEPEEDSKRIPKRRFDEVNERMKRAERRLEDLEKVDDAAEEAAVEKYDFDNAEEEYMDFVLDGKKNEAKQKRAEIRAAEKAEIKAETAQETHTTVDENSQRRELNSLSSEAAELYPIFNNTHDDYDENAAAKVITFMLGYRAEGMDAADAFVSGLADTIDLFDLDTKYGETESPSDDDPDPKRVKKDPKDAAAKIDLGKDAVKSPAGQGDASADLGAAKVNVDQLSDEELDALPAESLKRLRGDYITEKV